MSNPNLLKKLYFCLNDLIKDKDVLDFIDDYYFIENNYYLTDLYNDSGHKSGMISFEFSERKVINESIFYKGTSKIFINDIELAIQIEINPKNTEIGHLASIIIAESTNSNNNKKYTVNIKPFIFENNLYYNLAPGIGSCLEIYENN